MTRPRGNPCGTTAGLAEPRMSMPVRRCQRLAPQQPHLGWLTGIGEPVDGAQGAAHLLVEAAGRHVDVLSLDLEPRAAAGSSPVPGGPEQRRPDAPPRSRGDTRISHSTATPSRPPGMSRPGVLLAIMAPPTLAPSRQATMSPPFETSK